MKLLKIGGILATSGLGIFVLGNNLLNPHAQSNLQTKVSSFENDNNQGNYNSGQGGEESSSSSSGVGSSSSSKTSGSSSSDSPSANLEVKPDIGFILPIQSFSDLELAIKACGPQEVGSEAEKENTYRVLKNVIAQEKISNKEDWPRLKWMIEFKWPQYNFCLNPSKEETNSFLMYKELEKNIDKYKASEFAYYFWILKNIKLERFDAEKLKRSGDQVTRESMRKELTEIFKSENSKNQKEILWKKFFAKKKADNWFNESKFDASRVNLVKTSYKNNVLTTPFFKMKYQDDGIVNKKSQQWKENFLKEMYTEFINSATFGNEIYTLEEIVFNQSANDNVAAGGYSWKDFKININFTTDSFNKYDVFYTLIHEYYHHLTFSKMENLLHEYNNVNKKELDAWYNNHYMKLFNWRKKLNDNVLNTRNRYQFLKERTGEVLKPNDWQHNVQFLPLVYNHELNQYYENYFKNKSNGQFIFFDRLTPNKLPLFNNLTGLRLSTYYASVEEQMARTMSLVTNAFQNKENDLFKLTAGSGLIDYLMMLFTKQNVYYKYDSEQRKFPKVAYTRDGTNLFIKPSDQLKWEGSQGKGIIKDFTEEKTEEMNKKHQEWKKYFENTFYNQDQLFSSAFRDKDNNLYIELNAKGQKITLEYNDGKGGIVDYEVPVEELTQTGQITFNTNPYNKDTRKTSKLTNHVYKIKASDLPKRDYYLKVNGKYLYSGFNLWYNDNNKQTKRTIWTVHKPSWEDSTNGNEEVVAKYRFSIDQNNLRVKLEVLYTED